jgi:hypothetical protein
MTYHQRWLIPVIMTLLLINGGLMWLIFRYGQTQFSATTIRPPATAIAEVQTTTTTMTTQCHNDIVIYMELSRQRIYTYYEYYDAIPTAVSTSQLATKLKALSKDVPALPTNCPADIAALLNANYLSVYASAPIHLYVIISKSQDGVIENANTRMALRLFQREIDIAETTTLRILKALQH